MLNLNYDITHLRGAEYNPRKIGESDLERLARSIREIGIVKPLIARGDVLVAGHQRTRALRSLGITHAPVYLLPCQTTTYDEVRFNQLHNGTDFDSGDECCRISGLAGKSGFVQVQHEQVTGNQRAKMAYVRKDIAQLITKYGSWGACVATESGEVIHCAQYALAAKATLYPLTVYVIPDSAKKICQEYLGERYGVFDYAHLDKATYTQTYAQKFRLRKGGKGRSVLYESFVIPSIRRTERGFDFGSGQGDYAKMLRANGFNLHDLEFFRRKKSWNTLDTATVTRMIDTLIDDLKTQGRYDYVVCDSVLNSVDCQEAERAVLGVINGFCKPGGTVYFSGRPRKSVEKVLLQTKAASRICRLAFLDANGFTAQFRKGNWFYQKFHTPDDINAICAKYRFSPEVIDFQDNGWYVKATVAESLPLEDILDAIRYEFELPLPGGKTIGRSADVSEAFSIAC